jgi:hypothetical protein
MFFWTRLVLISTTMQLQELPLSLSLTTTNGISIKLLQPVPNKLENKLQKLSTNMLA